VAKITRLKKAMLFNQNKYSRIRGKIQQFKNETLFIPLIRFISGHRF